MEAKNNSERDVKKDVLNKQPETLFQFFKLMIIAIVKNSPKMFIAMIIRSAIIFGFVMFVNAYVIAYINEGWRANINRSSPWFYLLNLAGNKAAFNALCFVFFYIVFAVYARIKATGIKIFFLDILGALAWTSKSTKIAGKAALPVFVGFVGLALYFRAFTENKYLFITLTIGLFLTYTLQNKNMIVTVSKLAWSDIQRLFAKKKPKKELNVGAVSLAILGAFFGILLLNFIPFNKQWIPYVLGGVLIGLSILIAKNRVSPKTAVMILAFGLVSYLLYRLQGQIFADDGGWREGGSNLGSYIKSGAGKAIIASGKKPGLLASLGSLLGNLLYSGYSKVVDATSYIGNKAGQAYDYVAHKTGKAYDYVKDKAGKAYDYAADTLQYAATFTKEFGKAVAKDFAEAGQQIADFAGKAKDAIVDGAVGVKDFVKDVWENPQILKDGLVNSLNTVKDGLSSAYDYTKDLTSDIWDNPKILWNTAVGSAETVKNIASNVWNAVYTTVTDPKKAWEFAKDMVGVNNFANSIDPNRSLLERLGNTSVGLFKLGSTLFTAGEAGAALKGAGSKAMGFMDNLTTSFSKKGVKGMLDDVGGLFGEKGIRKPLPKGTSPFELDIKPGPNYTTSAKGVDVSAIPTGSQKSLQYVADEMGVQIHVRYSNPASKPWIESGKAVPKPCAIKAKTLNPIDELIGGPKNQEGLVGFFKPKKPSREILDKMRPEFREKVLKRFAQREAEYNKLLPEMKKLHLDRRFQVKDGIVHDVVKGKPVAGDVDLFDITSFDGAPLPKHVQEQVVDRLKSIATSDRSISNIEHGAVTMWDETDHAFDAFAKNKMLDSARDGGEGVITFNPYNKPTQSFLKQNAYRPRVAR